MPQRLHAVGIATLTLLAGLAATEATASMGEDTVRVSTDQGRIVVTDSSSGRVLYDQRNQRVYMNRNNDAFLIPELEVVPQPTGMDLVYTYTNDSSEPRPLSDMRVGPLVMPDDLTMQDTKMIGGQDKQISVDNRPSIAYTYPDNTYSPVYVLRDEEQAVGVSMLYPLFEYKHDVQFRTRPAPPADDQHNGWIIDIRVSRLDGDQNGRGWIDYGAMLEPGESRSYTITIRYDRNPEEWVRTLEPYRDYFRGIYGGVHYHRRDNAAVIYSTGEGSDISRSNPYGYRSERIRPDVHGFGPMVDQMMSLEGWSEMLVVKPSGHYFRNQQWNYPFLMLSNLTSSDELQTAFDRDVGLASVPARGRDLSFWWGRSLQVANEWDPVSCHPLDPRNPADRDAAFAEIDLAAQLGATGIGMDTYTHDLLPVWDSYAWLRDMMDRHPQMHFFIEPMVCDAMHSLAPTWIRGYNESGDVQVPDDIYRLKGPNMLADFLLPGHESVVPMRYQMLQQRFNIEPTQERINRDARRFASWGYRPLMATGFNLEDDVQSHESWLTTIPADLQIPRHEWVSGVDPYNGSGGFTDAGDSDGYGDDDDGPGGGFEDMEVGSGVVSRDVQGPPGSSINRGGGGGGGGGGAAPTFDYDPKSDRMSIGSASEKESDGAIRVHRRSGSKTATIRYNPKTDRISKPPTSGK